jgi:hypothetical protein
MKLAVALAVCAMGCGGMASPSDAPASTDAMGDGYAAFAMIGGDNRIRITKNAGMTCFAIQLVSPGTGSGGLTLPNGWAFESAQAMQPGLACDPRYLGPVTASFQATSQSGTITWQGGGVPQAVQSVQVTLVFAGNPPWCPPSEVVSASNVPVQG